MSRCDLVDYLVLMEFSRMERDKSIFVEHVTVDVNRKVLRLNIDCSSTGYIRLFRCIYLTTRLGYNGWRTIDNIHAFRRPTDSSGKSKRLYLTRASAWQTTCHVRVVYFDTLLQTDTQPWRMPRLSATATDSVRLVVQFPIDAAELTAVMNALRAVIIIT